METLKAIDNSAEESEKKGEESALENALKNSDFRKFAEDVLDTITTGKEERKRIIIGVNSITVVCLYERLLQQLFVERRGGRENVSKQLEAESGGV